MCSLKSQAKIASLLIILLFLLSGCASMKKAFGISIDLEDEPVDSIEAGLFEHEGLCPGYEGYVTISVMMADGEIHETEGVADGRVSWENFEIETDGAEIFEEGQIKLAANPYETLGEPAIVRINSIHHDRVDDEVVIPALYDCDFYADFSGTPGRDGEQGHSGQSGSRGQSPSSSYRAGGNGQSGGDGAHGGQGEHGLDADDVEVFIDVVDDHDPLLVEVEVVSLNSGETTLHLFDPNSGQFTVLAHGGRGGHGGNGGGGGDGGHGGAGEPNGNGGDGGSGGNGGNGADGGNGGSVVIIATEAAEPYIDRILVDNSGGAAGQPGAAGFGGSGGGASSGAHSGNSGQNGIAGSRAGREGRSGPPVEVEIAE